MSTNLCTPPYVRANRKIRLIYHNNYQKIWMHVIRPQLLLVHIRKQKVILVAITVTRFLIEATSILTYLYVYL